jgi:hypothetical protein
VPKTADFSLSDHGSVALVTPLSPSAREWVDENVSLESWQWVGGSFACDPRYVDDLVAGITGDGLTIE